MIKTVKLGLLGYGTVGKGVYNIISKNNKFYQSIGLNIIVSKICVKDINKKRSFSNSTIDPIVTNLIDDVVLDPNIDIIVEVMGGVDIPYQTFKNSIKKNKHFVTANKALLASKLVEIEESLQNNKIKIGYEAAVGGGIPIIETLQKHYLSDNVKRISGIINGTTNFILTKMAKENKDYNDVLKEAQELGFAEADPSSDVLGYDARSKISILSYVGMGSIISPDDIYTRGIEKISKKDFEYARHLNSTIKHMVFSEYVNDEVLSCYVMPTIVSNDSPISDVAFENNVVDIISEYNNHCTLIGKGAGAYPTATSVVKDIINISRELLDIEINSKTLNSTTIQNSISKKNNNNRFERLFTSKFMIRLDVIDELGIIEVVGRECKNLDISIDAVLQLPQKNKNPLTFALTTDITSISNIEMLINKLEKEKFYIDSNILKII